MSGAAHIAGDDEIDDRLRTIESTAAKIQAGEPVTGGPTAEGLVGDEVVKKVRDWLGLRSSANLHPIEAVDDPDRLARLFLEAECSHPDGPTLRHLHGEWLRWDGASYRNEDAWELDSRLTRTIKVEFDRKSIEAQAKNDERNSVARKVTHGLLGNVRLALQSKVIVPSNREIPCWIDGEAPWPAEEVLPAQNGLFHLPSLAQGIPDQLEPTPRFFSTFALDYPIEWNALAPEPWINFLNEVLPNDQASIATLQEWMGYCLTPDTRQHKILVLIGPPRSGKGTIGRIMRSIVGWQNVAGPTLNDFKETFGLQSLLGKSLAIISDARLHGSTDTVVERLLAISGEDLLTVNRKNLTSVDVKLTTRLVLISNELPRFKDVSGAVAHRMIVLSLTQSFLGREDTTLTDRLLKERPSILRWTVEGWRRLRERGWFVQPESGKELHRGLIELSSPIWTYVQERLIIGTWHRVSHDDIFHDYLTWCQHNGIRYTVARNTFGRDLRAAVPTIRDTQPRVGDSRVRFYEGIALRP